MQGFRIPDRSAACIGIAVSTGQTGGLCLRIMLSNYDKCQAGVRGVSDTKPELGMDIRFLLNWHGNCLIELPCAGAGRPRQTA